MIPTSYGRDRAGRSEKSDDFRWISMILPTFCCLQEFVQFSQKLQFKNAQLAHKSWLSISNIMLNYVDRCVAKISANIIIPTWKKGKFLPTFWRCKNRCNFRQNCTSQFQIVKPGVEIWKNAIIDFVGNVRAELRTNFHDNRPNISATSSVRMTLERLPQGAWGGVLFPIPW